MTNSISSHFELMGKLKILCPFLYCDYNSIFQIISKGDDFLLIVSKPISFRKVNFLNKLVQIYKHNRYIGDENIHFQTDTLESHSIFFSRILFVCRWLAVYNLVSMPRYESGGVGKLRKHTFHVL